MLNASLAKAGMPRPERKNMKQIITVTKQIEVHVDEVPNTDISLIRASWNGERKSDHFNKKAFHGVAFVKNSDVEKILKNLKNPDDLRRHNIKIVDPKDKNKVSVINLMHGKYADDPRAIFREDDATWKHWKDGDIPSDVIPVYVCTYNHHVYDMNGNFIIDKFSEFILAENGWKLKELIAFSETVDWLEFADVRAWRKGEKIDYVRGNGYTAYPTITIEPEVLLEIKNTEGSWNLFESLLAHKIGEDGVAQFKGDVDRDGSDGDDYEA